MNVQVRAGDPTTKADPPQVVLDNAVAALLGAQQRVEDLANRLVGEQPPQLKSVSTTAALQTGILGSVEMQANVVADCAKMILADVERVLGRI